MSPVLAVTYHDGPGPSPFHPGHDNKVSSVYECVRALATLTEAVSILAKAGDDTEATSSHTETKWIPVYTLKRINTFLFLFYKLDKLT